MKARYILSLVMVLFSGLATAQKLELVGVVSYKDEHNVCVYLDRGDKTFTSFSVTKYDMVTGQNWTTNSADAYTFGDGYYLLPVDGNGISEFAYKVKALFSDDTVLETPNIELKDGATFHWLGSDLKCSKYQSEYKSVIVYDQPIDGSANTPITLDGTRYYKSYSVHAYGFLEFDFTEDSPYSRFYTKYGIMDSNNYGDVVFSFIVDGSIVEQHTVNAKSSGAKGPYIREFEMLLNGVKKIKMQGEVIDNNWGDHMNFVMGRVYFKQDERKEQTVDFPESQILPSDRPFIYEIPNLSSSGLKPYFRIVKGIEYATINGNRLSINAVPSDSEDYIEVEAFQPGNEEYKPSQLYRCKYYVRNIKTVQKDEKIVLKNGEVVEELTVYGDFKTMGQVVVESGFAKINKLKLKYTFVPGAWNFISFPGNFNIDEISNLNELGYYFNKKPKAYYIREYSTKDRTEGTGNTWKSLSSPEIKMNKGYIMGVARSSDNPDSTPVEVTFTIENSTLGVKNTLDGTLNVQLDMTALNSGEEFEVVVSPVDVKGIPLVVKVKYEPKTEVEQPLNFEKALLDARVTFNPNHSGIRLTLPDDTPAKVLIFNKKGKLVKAVKYVSPYLIDIQDLKKGKYDMIIEYGNARDMKSFEVE